MNNTFFILIAMIIYLVFMICIGLFFSKKSSKNTNTYFLGGRQLGPLITAMSAEASDMSGYLLMGLPGLAYFTGVCDVTWTAIGLAIGTYLNWLFVAKRLRNYSVVAGNSITIPEFLSNRYKDKTNIIKTISALFILVFFTVYVASCFVTCGKLFSRIFDTNYHNMLLIGALIVLIYTLIGGFLAVSTTDLIQAVIMILALICVMFFGISNAGGFDKVIENAKSIPGYLSMNEIANPIIGASGFNQPISYGFLTIISTLAWGLGYFGMPQVLIRFMAIRDAKEIKTSRRIAIIWVVISMATAIIIGIIGRSLYLYSEDLSTNGLAESIFIKLSMSLLPALLCGFCLAGILAAAMSSADSYLLITASSIVQDIYKGVLHKNADDKLLIKLSKFVLLFVSLISIYIAWDENSVIFQVVSFAWAGFGATFGPIILFSLFYKNTTKIGAIAGILSGGAMIFIWKLLLKPMGGIFAIYELLPAFIISCLFILIFSKISKKPSSEILSEFDKVKNM